MASIEGMNTAGVLPVEGNPPQRAYDASGSVPQFSYDASGPTADMAPSPMPNYHTPNYHTPISSGYIPTVSGTYNASSYAPTVGSVPYQATPTYGAANSAPYPGAPNAVPHTLYAATPYVPHPTQPYAPQIPAAKAPKTNEVDKWLEELDPMFCEYEELFRRNTISKEEDLEGLTDEDLKEIGITNKFHRRKIMKGIQKLAEKPKQMEKKEEIKEVKREKPKKEVKKEEPKKKARKEEPKKPMSRVHHFKRPLTKEDLQQMEQEKKLLKEIEEFDVEIKKVKKQIKNMMHPEGEDENLSKMEKMKRKFAMKDELRPLKLEKSRLQTEKKVLEDKLKLIQEDLERKSKIVIVSNRGHQPSQPRYLKN